MSKLVKWSIVLLFLGLLAFMFVPGIIMLFSGGGHV
jgi:hypothetical protein